MQYNTVDPIGDAGMLRHMFDPQNLFPILLILMLFAGFAIAWVLALVVDFRNAQQVMALRSAHIYKFGELREAEGVSEVRGACVACVCGSCVGLAGVPHADILHWTRGSGDVAALATGTDVALHTPARHLVSLLLAPVARSRFSADVHSLSLCVARRYSCICPTTRTGVARSA
jgi:hypothetical protein